MKFGLRYIFCALFFCAALRLEAAPRVALMDFSTDDNSYRSAQAAADFAALLQAQLTADTNVEWVERAQLDKAREELELSVAETMNGEAAIQRGKWVKADWLITGQFSLDDRNQRTLFLEITDLSHADVLASQTIILPGNKTQSIELGKTQVDFVADTLRQLLTKAHQREQQSKSKILVAPLFFADTSSHNASFSRKTDSLEQDFDETLERLAATNGRIQLIHFPKAYRSAEESEMVFDGLVEAGQSGWQLTADVYVWGTYAVEEQRTNKPPHQQIALELHVWDGISRPEIIRKRVPCSFGGDFQTDEMQPVINRLASDVIARAHKRTRQIDSSAIRKSIAASLVKAYDGMTLHFNDRENLGLGNSAKFLQAVHMLEIACFFDPDNANARALYITCRWGWWIDFNLTVKNEFWSKWRRSQAWGKYVERFGLNPITEQLPFPYQQEGGIPETYFRSLKDVLELFPQWHSEEEMNLDDKWRQQGVYTGLTEAEYHGFPKQMPHNLAWQWKKDVEKEYWKRLTKVAGFVAATGAPKGKSPSNFLANLAQNIINADQPASARWSLIKTIWPASVQYAQERGHQWIIKSNALLSLAKQAGQTEKAQRMLAMLAVANPPAKIAAHHPATVPKPSSPDTPAPAWLQEIRPTLMLFRLMPPNVLTTKVKPTVREFKFPEQFDIQVVSQLGLMGSRLLIRAMDERSAPSSDARPNVSADILSEYGRLWILDPSAAAPVLFKPELFKESINQFLLQSNRLWVAGKTTGYLDLKDNRFRKFSFADGLNFQQARTIGSVAGSIFVGDDAFNVFRFDSRSGHWNALPKPGNYSYGTGTRYQIVGSGKWLNYSPSSGLFYNLKTETWTNLLPGGCTCELVDPSGFWLGGRGGLVFYDTRNQTLLNRKAPTTIEGLINAGMISTVVNGTMPSRELEKYSEQVAGALERWEMQRLKTHSKNPQTKKSNNQNDPLNLNWRIPGEITALAADGDFLWLGAANYFGDYLLLLHKPSRSLVAYFPMPTRDKISSLAVSKNFVWIGTAYGDHKLLRLDKNAFLSIPQSRWTALAISPEERADLIRHMSVRDQAMYAFYAGNDERVKQLLQNTPPEKTSLEEMFLLAFSNDALGVDKIERARFWFGQITNRYPGSPMAKVAQAALVENEQNHKIKAHKTELLAKYDLNHDGILDENEKHLMEKDSNFQHEENAWRISQLDQQIKETLSKFDRNGNGKLDRDELDYFKSQVLLFSHAPAQMLVAHKITVAPFLTKKFPSVEELLKKYDTNRDGTLDIDELKALATDIQNSPEKIILRPNVP